MSANTESKMSTKKRRNQVQHAASKAARVSSEEEQEVSDSSGRDVKNMEQVGATTTTVTTQGADLNDDTDSTVELLVKMRVRAELAEDALSALKKAGVLDFKTLRSICSVAKPDALVILERYGVPDGPANRIWDYFNRTFSLCCCCCCVIQLSQNQIHLCVGES